MKIKKILYKKVKEFLNKLPYIKTLHKQSLNCCYPNGHYYSPVFSIEDVKSREFEIWRNVNKEKISGIELRIEEQKKLILQFLKFYDELPFKNEKQDNIRFKYNNNYYSYADGIILYSMIRQFEPKRIIEIGSGFSSMVMLDTNEFFFDNQIDLTFIDPYPERLFSLMKESDIKQTKVIECDVQLVPLNVFEKLQAGDILFIDSTHISKTGSDVNYILFEIFPIIKNGVLIHFHDVFYPFEYPKEWVFQGINWNENYILKAFLMHNEKFEVKLFSEYLYRHHKDVFIGMPLCYNYAGSNLWLEKK